MCKFNYNVSKTQLFSGCLLGSIAHAMMTNIYPKFSYEQSWDGKNYSQQFERYRMTISFEEDFCVGAIRDECLPKWYGEEIYNVLHRYQCPQEAITLLKEESLEYLLDHLNNVVVPIVSSVFWCNHENMIMISAYHNTHKHDFSKLSVYTLPIEQQIEYWQSYYDTMNADHILLLKNLYERKLSHSNSFIYLTETEKKMLPGNYIDKECAISFAELNIIL